MGRGNKEKTEWEGVGGGRRGENREEGEARMGGEGRVEERVEAEKGKKGKERVRFQALGIVSFKILRAFTKKTSG